MFYFCFLRLGVTDEMLKPFLEDLSLKEALDAKRLFIVDHIIVQDLPHRKGYHVGLLYYTWYC